MRLCLKIIEKEKKMRFILLKNIRLEKEIIDNQTGKKAYDCLLVAYAYKPQRNHSSS